MAFGEGGAGNFAGTGGYGGQFPGFGGASAGYTGGYGNPSSVGGGTAGQTQNSVAYANTLNKYNSTLPNYSGVTNSVTGPSGSGGISLAPSAAKKKSFTPTQQQYIQAKAKYYRDQAAKYDAGEIEGQPPNFMDYGSWVNQNAVSPSLGVQRPAYASNTGSSYSGYGSPLQGNYSSGFGPHGYGTGSSYGNVTDIPRNPQGPPAGAQGTAGSGGYDPNAYRQFGGPVAPGGQYTVGENGPETLQMGAQGGQVIPNNPVDRLGGMNPGMMQALFQLMQQQGGQRPGMNPGQAPVGQPAPTPQPPMRPPGRGAPGQGPGMGSPGSGGGFRLGDWRNRMGIEGLSRPAQQPGMGFGGSGLGASGIMPQMRGQLGS